MIETYGFIPRAGLNVTLGNLKRGSEHGVLKWILGGLIYVVVAGLFYCIIKGGNEYDNNQENSKTDRR